MTAVQISQFREDLSHLGNMVAYQGERICVERNHKPLFAVVPYPDMELLEQLEDKMDLESAREALKRNDFISWKQVKKELGL